MKTNAKYLTGIVIVFLLITFGITSVRAAMSKMAQTTELYKFSGTWVTHVGGMQTVLQIYPNGQLSYIGFPGVYQLTDVGKMVITHGVEGTQAYSYKVTGNMLHLIPATTGIPRIFFRSGGTPAMPQTPAYQPQMPMDDSGLPEAKTKGSVPDELVDTWVTGSGEKKLEMVLKEDGSMSFAGNKWQLSVIDGKMHVDTGQGIAVYDLKLKKDSFIMSGGDIEEQLVFKRKSAIKSASKPIQGPDKKTKKETSTQKLPELLGDWKTMHNGNALKMIFKSHEDVRFGKKEWHYSIRKNQLHLDTGATVLVYDLVLNKDRLTLSGGDLEKAIVFKRQGTKIAKKSNSEKKTRLPTLRDVHAPSSGYDVMIGTHYENLPGHAIQTKDGEWILFHFDGTFQATYLFRDFPNRKHRLVSFHSRDTWVNQDVAAKIKNSILKSMAHYIEEKEVSTDYFKLKLVERKYERYFGLDEVQPESSSPILTHTITYQGGILDIVMVEFVDVGHKEADFGVKPEIETLGKPAGRPEPIGISLEQLGGFRLGSTYHHPYLFGPAVKAKGTLTYNRHAGNSEFKITVDEKGTILGVSIQTNYINRMAAHRLAHGYIDVFKDIEIGQKKTSGSDRHHVFERAGNTLTFKYTDLNSRLVRKLLNRKAMIVAETKPEPEYPDAGLLEKRDTWRLHARLHYAKKSVDSPLNVLNGAVIGKPFIPPADAKKVFEDEEKVFEVEVLPADEKKERENDPPRNFHLKHTFKDLKDVRYLLSDGSELYLYTREDGIVIAMEHRIKKKEGQDIFTTELDKEKEKFNKYYKLKTVEGWNKDGGGEAYVFNDGKMSRIIQRKKNSDVVRWVIPALPRKLAGYTLLGENFTPPKNATKTEEETGIIEWNWRVEGTDFKVDISKDGKITSIMKTQIGGGANELEEEFQRLLTQYELNYFETKKGDESLKIYIFSDGYIVYMISFDPGDTSSLMLLLQTAPTE